MNLYIHIPFCASKCSYCHFYSICDLSILNDYIKALITEIKLRFSTVAAETIYFGGGTPSLLSPSQLEQILQVINHADHVEITLEAHPNTLTPTRIKDLFSLGINRLSIGIQTWSLHLLAHMGRKFDPNILQKSIIYAQSLGLTNINIDHIISYPNQTDQIVANDIRTTLSCKPSHISVYPLEHHPHTAIKRSPMTKKIIRQFALVQRLLIAHNYRHYEELNFCQTGYACQHNLDFWRGKPFIGVGVSATSFVNHTIIANNPNIREYISSLKSGHLPSQQHQQLTTHQYILLKNYLKNRILIKT